MKKKVIFLMLILLFLILPQAYAFSSNSTNYKLILTTLSDGGDVVNSSNYKNIISLGIISWVISSADYISKLGFLHALLLADGQPCTNDNQCEGGFCCSNTCASSCPAPRGAGGGAGAEGAPGGGGGEVAVVIKKDYSVSPSSIKAELLIEKSETKKLKIENKGNAKLDFSLDVIGVENFVSLSESSFSLDINEEKTITLEIYGKDFGAYSGSIIINGGGIEKAVPITIEVASETVLFDAKIDIPSAYKEVRQGDDLKAQITLLNVGAPKKADVIITYLIKDFKGNIIYEESETFAVDKQKSYVKEFSLPKNIPLGDYLVVIEVRYSNSFAVSSEMFSVVEKKAVTLQELIKMPVYNLVLVILLLAGALFLFLSILMPKKTSRKKR